MVPKKFKNKKNWGQTLLIGERIFVVQGRTCLLSYNMSLNTQEYWRAGISKMAKNDKNRNFVAPKIHQIFFLLFFNKNSWKLTKRTEKKQKNL
jgi:hypothetical protein